MTKALSSLHAITYKLVFALLVIIGFTQPTKAQEKSIILGRPTDTSVTASILFNQTVNYYIEYGTQTGVYTGTTATYSNVLNVPDEIDITDLIPNTQYYYRMQYKLTTSTTYTATAEYKFHTQRAPGNSFVFTIEADEHLYDVKGDRTMYQVTLANELADSPDFMLSLGDIFGDDHTPTTTTSADMDALHKDYRQYLGQICHSVPFFVCLGNHEGENDYYLNQNPPNNIGVWGTLWRKYYYPNPIPNSFYNGNTIAEGYGMDTPENYYAWTWGDALFVVLDVYRTEIFPGATPADPTKPTNWDWTLGYTQYQWMRSLLENSNAAHKFVFAHHSRGQGRGGTVWATGFEWGGMDGNQNRFNQYRPGWGKTIHQVFVDTGVDIFFQGHDHLYAKEVLNNVVYQEVPMPSDITYTIGYTANANAYTDVKMDGTGHIRVAVTPSCVTVDYVKAYIPGTTGSEGHTNREIGYSYTLGSSCALNTSVVDTSVKVSVFPNPANNQLNIAIADNAAFHHFELVTLLGQTVAKFDTNEYNTSALSEGIYFLKIDGTPNLTKKIIIKH